MARLCILVVALGLGGCNFMSLSSRPDVAVPGTPAAQAGEAVAGAGERNPDLDCDPRAGRISC